MPCLYRYTALLAVAGSVMVAGCHGKLSESGPDAAAGKHAMSAARTGAAPAAASRPIDEATPGTRLSAPKLSPELAAMARKVFAAPSDSAAQALSNQRVHVNAHRQIQVYIYVETVDSSTKARLVKAGADVEGSQPAMKVYQAWADPVVLGRIAGLPGVEKITPPAYGFPR